MKKQSLYNYLLRLGDDNLILAQRTAEWCSNGPILEEDLALVNVSLDLFGQAESFLEYAAEVKGDGSDADDLAFGRDERTYFNHLIAEMPNGDFAQSMVRLAFFSAYMKEQYAWLAKSSDERIAAISAKAYKEARYHFRHASDWIIRLGRGTQESQKRTQAALNEIWSVVDDMFETDQVYQDMHEAAVAPDMREMKSAWEAVILPVMQEAGLVLPYQVHQLKGGIRGYHTEHLGHLLCEMQYLHRAHPGARW